MGLRRLASAFQGVRQGTQALQNIQLFKVQLEEKKRTDDLKFKKQNLEIDILENKLDPEIVAFERDKLKREKQMGVIDYNQAVANVAKTNAETKKLLEKNKILFSGEFGKQVGVSITEDGVTRKSITHAQKLAEEKRQRKAALEERFDDELNRLERDETLTNQERADSIESNSFFNSLDFTARARERFNVTKEDKETKRTKQYLADLADAERRREAGEDEEDLVRALKVKYPEESVDINRVFNQRGVQGEVSKATEKRDAKTKLIVDQLESIRQSNPGFTRQDAEKALGSFKTKKGKEISMEQLLSNPGINATMIQDFLDTLPEAEKEPGLLERAKDVFGVINPIVELSQKALEAIKNRLSPSDSFDEDTKIVTIDGVDYMIVSEDNDNHPRLKPLPTGARFR